MPTIHQQDTDLDLRDVDIVNDLHIPKVEIGVLLVNGRHVNLDHSPDGGDVLAIFPVIGGG